MYANHVHSGFDFSSTNDTTGRLDANDKRQWKAIIEILESMPDEESEWAFATMKEAKQLHFIDDEEVYLQSIKPYEYIYIKKIKNKLNVSYRSNTDVYMDFKHVFTNGLRYYSDPSLDSAVHEYRRFTWAMLQKFDSALDSNPLLKQRLLQENIRFRVFYNAFPGALPVIKMLEAFHENHWDDTYHLYYRDGYYHPDENYEEPDDYLTYVKEPLFLGDIFANLAMGTYTNYDKVRQDMEKVFNNNIVYFGEDTEQGQRSIKLRQLFTSVWNNTLPVIQASAQRAVQQQQQQTSAYGTLSPMGSRTSTSDNFTISSHTNTTSRIQKQPRGSIKSTKQQTSEEDYHEDVHTNSSRTLSRNASNTSTTTPTASSTGLKMKLSLKRPPTTTAMDSTLATPSGSSVGPLVSPNVPLSTPQPTPNVPNLTPAIINPNNSIPPASLSLSSRPSVGMDLSTFTPLSSPPVGMNIDTPLATPVTVLTTTAPLYPNPMASSLETPLSLSSTGYPAYPTMTAIPTASMLSMPQSSLTSALPMTSLTMNAPTPSLGMGGLNSNLTGLGSNTTGLGSFNTGLNSMSTGLGSNLTGLPSGSMTAMGSGTTGLNASTTGLGSYSTGLTSNTTGLGSFSTGLGSFSTGLGSNTTGLGSFSTGLGSTTTGLGSFSTGLGSNTTGLGSFSTGLSSNNTGLNNTGAPVFSSLLPSSTDVNSSTSLSNSSVSSFGSGSISAASIAAASSAYSLPSSSTTILTSNSISTSSIPSRLPPPSIPPSHKKSSNTGVDSSRTTGGTRASERASVPPIKPTANQLFVGKVPTTPEEIHDHMQQLMKHIYSPGIRITKKVHIKGSKDKIISINLTPFFENDPVTQGATDYNTRIEKPMWLAKIVENFQNGQYKTSEALRDDLLLIGTNCKQYNAGVMEWEWRANQWIDSITRLYDKLFRGLIPRRGRPTAGKGDSETMRYDDAGSISSHGPDNSRTGSPIQDDEMEEDTEMDTQKNIDPTTQDEYNDTALLGVEEAVPGAEFTAMPVHMDDQMHIDQEPLPVRTDGLGSSKSLPSAPSTSTLSTANSMLTVPPSTTDVPSTSEDSTNKGKSNRFLRFVMKSSSSSTSAATPSLSSSNTNNAPSSAAPTFSDEGLLSHDQLFVIKTIYDLYPFFNEPLSKELRSLCDGLLRRLSKHELCRGINGIPSLVTSAMKDPRFFTILWRLGLLAKPTVTFAEITNKLHNTLETAFLTEEANRLSNYEYNRKYRDRIQAMRQAMKYSSLGEFMTDLLNLFTTAITLYSKETWTNAGLHYEISWLESRYLRAQAMNEYVRSLIREYFATVIGEEAKQLASVRQSLRQMVENAAVTPSTRPVLISAVQTMLGINDLGRKSGFAKISKEFSAPVGILHPDIPGIYWSIIAQPMDFGTISEQLQLDTNVQAETNKLRPIANSVYYNTHGRFAADIVLTLQNAIKYNTVSGHTDTKVLENARTLLMNWTNVVWPETCLDISLILKLEGFEQGVAERIRKAEEERQEATRRTLQAAAYVHGAQEVVRDADIWITRTTEALKTGDLEALPGVFLPSDGVLSRATEKLNYQPANALTVISAALDKELRQANTTNTKAIITPVKSSTKLYHHLQSLAEAKNKQNMDHIMDIDMDIGKKNVRNGNNNGTNGLPNSSTASSRNETKSSSTTITSTFQKPMVNLQVTPGKQTSALLSKLGISAKLELDTKH